MLILLLTGSTSSNTKQRSNGQSSTMATDRRPLKGKMAVSKISRRINFAELDMEDDAGAESRRFAGICEGMHNIYITKDIYYCFKSFKVYSICNIIFLHLTYPITDYIDHGDSNVECAKCGAMLWYHETIRGDSNCTKDAFPLCCGRGKVKLPVALKDPPKPLKQLMNKEHPKSSSFMDNIRRYNSMFAFTSMGGKQDKSVNVGRGPYCYRIEGQNLHKIGTLLPEKGKPPKFAQLYIYDKPNEIRNRINAVRFVH
jgi:hypothetical protein